VPISFIGAKNCLDKLSHLKRCKNAGIDCILPLWHQNREALVREIIEAGLLALIKIVQADKLDESFLGKDLSIPLIEKIKQTGSDVCGENGEYHTFVHDGPIFSHPILLRHSGIVDYNG
jgi:diphthamide synthase (EF-2-diphthine--ammonia ligase)